LSKGSTSEADLNALDRKLETTIKKMREERLAKTQKSGEQQPMKINSRAASNGFDAKSVAKSIQGSEKANNMRGSSSNGFVNGHRVVCEDPAAQLNIDDAQWNNIVQANLKKFTEDKEKAIRDKFAKNKAIQDEQLRQIEQKK